MAEAIERMFRRYNLRSVEEIAAALREILQEVASLFGVGTLHIWYGRPPQRANNQYLGFGFNRD